MPAAFPQAVEVLKRHGIEVQELREDLELDVEVYRLDKVERSPRRFEGHQAVELTATPRREPRMIKAGTLVVRTAQPLGNLAVYLLEPGSEDGLATWNFFDEGLKEGSRFPGRPAASAGTDVRSARLSPSPKTAGRSGRSRSIRAAAVGAGAAAGSAAFSAVNSGSTTSTGCRSGTVGSSKCTLQPAAPSRSWTRRRWPRVWLAFPRSTPIRPNRSPAGCHSTWIRTTEASSSSMPRTSTTRRSISPRRFD